MGTLHMSSSSQKTTPKDYEHLTWIGSVFGVHGVRGALKVKPHTDTPRYYLKVQKLFLEVAQNLTPLTVHTFRMHQGCWLIGAQEIPSRTEAELLRRSRILIEDSLLRPLDKEEVFWHQLIGCDVEDENGKHLGKVTSIMETGANDVYTVSSKDHEFLLPNTKEIIKMMDMENKRICIDPIPGLIEE